MQITLTQAEIEQALKNHVNEIMTIKDGMDYRFAFKAGRGEDGLSVAIDIEKAAPVTQVPSTPVKRAPAISKVETPAAEPKPEAKTEPAPPFTPDAEVPIAAQPQKEQAAEQAPAQEAAAEAAPKRASLFGDLANK
ncbi:hypothetical protein Axy22_052 [Achromobacter phage vB_AxyP_19-32_Axy22]|uniref:Uncharacterized protein n=1 Tax=Achromobacter phage vB_AxyP_19-32_Axy22 TaxID=2591046 RepID=A0A514CVX0_9CAUD|nr:hypothetical protein Axy22_052 [Achromobacter phage vB_AxyP_19-32_Axy22]